MPDWPSGFGAQRLAAIGLDATSSRGVTVTSGAANTKGSYAQLSASTPMDADGFHMHLLPAGATADYLVDIALGGAGSEVVIVPDFFMYGNNGSLSEIRTTSQVYVPIPIKAGTRVAARFQSNGATQTLTASLTLVAGDYYSSMRCGRATSYGITTATTVGTTIDPGGTINTKGSYAQISASLDRPIRYAILSLSARRNGTVSAQTGLLDIAVGAAASEQICVPDLPYGSSTATDAFQPSSTAIFLSAKSGERLAARAQSSINDATDRLFDLAVMGFD